MKNFNLCHIALILFSFITTIDSDKPTTISLSPSHSVSLTQTETEQDIDPDWKILIGHLTGNTILRKQKA